MEKIIVTSQKQLDEVPVDYHGRIIIKFGTPNNRALVKQRYPKSVETRGNGSVVARENSSVAGTGNAQIVDATLGFRGAVSNLEPFCTRKGYQINMLTVDYCSYGERKDG